MANITSHHSPKQQNVLTQKKSAVKAAATDSSPGSTPPQGNASSPKNPPPKRKNLQKKPKWKYIIGGVILLLLIIGGGAGYWLTQQSQDIRQQASTDLYNSGCMDRTDCVHSGGTVGSFCGNGKYFCDIPIPNPCSGTCISGSCSVAYMTPADGNCPSGQSCCEESSQDLYCGDAICNNGETADSCPDDCATSDPCSGTCMSQNCSAVYMVEASGSCSSNQFCCKTPDAGDFCGDGTCNYGETFDSCSEDCENFCGDGACNHGETYETCAADCEEKYLRWIPASM